MEILIRKRHETAYPERGGYTAATDLGYQYQPWPPRIPVVRLERRSGTPARSQPTAWPVGGSRCRRS